MKIGLTFLGQPHSFVANENISGDLDHLTGGNLLIWAEIVGICDHVGVNIPECAGDGG